MKVAIIGAGIIGLALARELRLRGADVVLVERQKPANEATWAAAGMLAPSAEAATPGDFFELCLEAATRYPESIRELEQETGLTTGYRAAGAMFLYYSDEIRQEVERHFSWQRERGVPIVHLDAQEVRVLEPEVRAPGGYLLPGESQVETRRLAAALVEACRRRALISVKARQSRWLRKRACRRCLVGRRVAPSRRRRGECSRRLGFDHCGRRS